MLMVSDSIGLPALTAFVEGTARAAGDGFFGSLTRNLAQVLEVREAVVTELVEPHKVRTLACWSAGQLIGNEERDVAGTPCEAVLAGEFRHHPTGVARQYPTCETGADSYIGMPLKSEEGAVLGHLCAWDVAPMSLAPAQLLLFEAFAASAAAELCRLLTERNTRATEERLRDLLPLLAAGSSRGPATSRARFSRAAASRTSDILLAAFSRR